MTMFADARAEIVSRTQAARDAFRYLTQLPEDAKTRPVLLHAKGLAFVTMYATYEYAVITAVRYALRELNRHRIEHGEARLEMLPLLMDADFKSAGQAGRNKRWKNRAEFLKKMYCSEYVEIDELFFPDDGTHFREDQLRTIWRIWGITADIVPHPPLLGLVAELVENRNAAAHGRRSIEDVGRDYSSAEIDKKFIDTQTLAIYILQTLEGHCIQRRNLTR